MVDGAIQHKDIGLGTLLWYKSFSSAGPWDCPAVIYEVNSDRRLFKVMSLDDMRKQDQWYNAVVNDHSPDSRISMRIASIAEVDAYLKKHKKKTTAQQVIAEAQERIRKKTAA